MNQLHGSTTFISTYVIPHNQNIGKVSVNLGRLFNFLCQHLEIDKFSQSKKRFSSGQELVFLVNVLNK